MVADPKRFDPSYVAPLPKGCCRLPLCERYQRVEANVLMCPEYKSCSRGAQKVYDRLGLFINAESREWQVSVGRLAQYADYSEDYVTRCLTELEKAKLIARREVFYRSRSGKIRQAANLYTLTTPPSLLAPSDPPKGPDPDDEVPAWLDEPGPSDPPSWWPEEGKEEATAAWPEDEAPLELPERDGLDEELRSPVFSGSVDTVTPPRRGGRGITTPRTTPLFSLPRTSNPAKTEDDPPIIPPRGDELAGDLERSEEEPSKSTPRPPTSAPDEDQVRFFVTWLLAGDRVDPEGRHWAWAAEATQHPEWVARALQALREAAKPPRFRTARGWVESPPRYTGSARRRTVVASLAEAARRRPRDTPRPLGPFATLAQALDLEAEDATLAAELAAASDVTEALAAVHAAEHRAWDLLSPDEHARYRDRALAKLGDLDDILEAEARAPLVDHEALALLRADRWPRLTAQRLWDVLQSPPSPEDPWTPS